MLIEEYNTIICNNKENINKMIDYFITFMKIKDNKYIGIDFEFNRIRNHRKIALFQINLEINKTKTIFMFYPPDLNNTEIKILKKLLINEMVILHGGESLDIPYLFNNIFITKNEQYLFCKKLFDTKYLCEYYNIENNNIKNKCKIYYLLLNQKVINKNKFNYLLENEEKMGPVYKIKINIKKMSKELTLYSAYDVVYLPRLYMSFPKNNLYENVLPQITSIIFIIKNNNFIKKQTDILNKFNMFKYNDINLVDYYKIVDYTKIKYNILYKINYFKKFWTMLIKLIIYIKIINNYDTYYKKNKLNKIKLNNFNYYINKFKFFNYAYSYFLELNDSIKITELIIKK
jgi:hypothetical protein